MVEPAGHGPYSEPPLLPTTRYAKSGNHDEGRHILIAVVRYLATHSPTERAALQTADIARRLMRGSELHQEVGAS